MDPPRGSFSRAGLLLIMPEGIIIEYVIRLGFKETNNEAEYEALIAGLGLAIEAGAIHLSAYTDSKLVEGQITGEYKAKEERMKKITG